MGKRNRGGILKYKNLYDKSYAIVQNGQVWELYLEPGESPNEMFKSQKKLLEILNFRDLDSIHYRTLSMLMLAKDYNDSNAKGQHILPKAYLRRFGRDDGKNTIYLEALRFDPWKRLLIEHSSMTISPTNHQFYTDRMESIMSYIEYGYSLALSNIQEGKNLKAIDYFNIAIFLSLSISRLPIQNSNNKIDPNSKDEMSDRIERQLTVNAINYLEDYYWKIISIERDSKESSYGFISSYKISHDLAPCLYDRFVKVYHASGEEMPPVRWFPLSKDVGVLLVNKKLDPIELDRDTTIETCFNSKSDILISGDISPLFSIVKDLNQSVITSCLGSDKGTNFFHFTISDPDWNIYTSLVKCLEGGPALTDKGKGIKQTKRYSSLLTPQFINKPSFEAFWSDMERCSLKIYP